MQCLVAFAVLLACVAASVPAVPQDTPEVALAKVAHFAEYNKAAAANGAPGYAAYPYSAYPYSAYPYSAYPYSAYPYNYAYSSYAAPVVTPQGYLADTPEVAAAKAVHFAEHAKAGSAVGAYSAYPYSAYPYNYAYSSYAAPVVTPQGYLADTPEVAAAKAAHFAEHAKAGSAVGAYSAYPYAAYPYSAYSYGYPYAYSSYAAPVVTPQGFLADTPEVAAAKSAHFAEVAKAKAAAY